MILIRNFRKSDIDNQYLSWINNSKNMKFSRHYNKRYTVKNSEIFYKKIKKKGYGLIAWKKAMKLIFRKGYKKIIGGTQLKNKPMIKIFINSNMKYENKTYKSIKGNTKKIYIVFYYKQSNLI